MTIQGKPFVKWVGGKGQLLEQLGTFLPNDFSNQEDVTYIEPFVGGGAMLFFLLQRYPNIKKAFINDVNGDLTTCYKVIKKNPHELITALKKIQETYYNIELEEDKRTFFLKVRDKYNTKSITDIENSTALIFLNRTCFNGLYRVNKSGKFNVPFGKYKMPTICDEKTILADSKILQKVEILTGDFEKTLQVAKKKSLFYFDPPYRPLNNTSSFNSYAKEDFNDEEQIRLKNFCDVVNNAGHRFMLNNSDGHAKNYADTFFDRLYATYNIHRVWARRSVNANAFKRGKLTEILVRNF